MVPRVKWLRPLGFEINIDEASIPITTLLDEEVEKGEFFLVIMMLLNQRKKWS